MSENASLSRARWLLVLLALAAALFLVVASACGGDDDDDDGGDTEPTATESADGDDDAEETPADEGDDDDDGGDVSDAQEKLAAFAGEYERFEGYVKYRATNFSDGALTSMSIYQDGTNSRIDIESPEGDVILITTADATYTCAENQCLKTSSSGDDGGLADAFASFVDPSSIEDTFGDIPDDVDVDVSEEEIAGIDATCFRASGDLDPDTPGDDESGEVCFAEGGLLLRVTFQGADGSGSLEAVEASRDVPAGAFEPPFEVVDLSELGQ